MLRSVLASLLGEAGRSEPAPPPPEAPVERDLLAGEISVAARMLPQPLFFAVGNICSANCVFCGYQNNVDPKIMMKFETFKKGFDQFLDIGGTYIDFTTESGDPLVDVDLPRKLEYARSRGIKRMSLATNGILLDYRDQYKALIDYGVDWVVLSTPGFDREAYSRIYRVEKYDDLLRGIQKIAAYKMERGGTTDIAISMRLDRPLAQALAEPDYLTYIKPWVDKGMIRVEESDCSTTVHNWAGQVVQEDLPPGMVVIKDPPAKRLGFTCSNIQHSGAVLANGDVRVCNCRYYKTERDELVIGNINAEPLKDILYSPRLAQLIDDTTRGNWPRSCQDCSFYQESPTWRVDTEQP